MIYMAAGDNASDVEVENPSKFSDGRDPGVSGWHNNQWTTVSDSRGSGLVRLLDKTQAPLV